MAQAPAVNTDELLSQLAASEIDRLLAEAESKPAPAPAPVAPAAPEPSTAPPAGTATAEVVADGPERAALLQAAGFEAAAGPAAESPDAGAAGQPTGDERSALLKAAGFASAEAPTAVDAEPDGSPTDVMSDDSYQPIPIYLKPLVWMNAPLNVCPVMMRPLLGKAGLLTLVNALAVLTYVFFFRKH